MTWAALASDYRTHLAAIETFADDHSPAAIFRRARRASYADATRARRWKARALNLNPDPLDNAIALSGMAPIRIDERWHLGVAVPQPDPLDHIIPAGTDVVLIDPVSGRATVMGDHSRAMVAPIFHRERIAVTTDARGWSRQIALDRLEWWHSRQARRRALQAELTWFGDISTALIIGPLARVRWSDLSADVIEVPADLRRNVQRAVLAEARLPRIEGRA